MRVSGGSTVVCARVGACISVYTCISIRVVCGRIYASNCVYVCVLMVAWCVCVCVVCVCVCIYIHMCAYARVCVYV